MEVYCLSKLIWYHFIMKIIQTIRDITRKIQPGWMLDTRSLSLFRVWLSLIVIADLLLRSRYLIAHYTDMGIYPRADYLSFGESATTFSLHAASGQLWYEILLFLIHGFFALWMLVGYRTKIATCIVWALTVSLQNRNMLIHSGADDLLRIVLFWSLFLPLDRYWSWDKNRYTEVAKKNIFSLWVVAFILQQFALYWVTAYLKLWSAWYGEHSAVYSILSLESFHLPLSDITYGFPWLMKIITVSSMYIEFFWPILLILPFFHSWLRIVWIGLISILQFGIMTHMSVGIFPWIALISISAFLPGAFWELLYRFRPTWNITIHYDDKCGLCTRWIRILQNFWMLSGVEYIWLSRSDESIRNISAEHDMWVIARGDRYFLGYEGFVEVMKQSYFLRYCWIIWKWEISTSLGRKIYHIISKKRKLCTLPRPVIPYQQSDVKHIVGIMVLSLSLYCSIMVNISVMACGNSWRNFFQGWIGNIFSLIRERNIHLLESEEHAGWIGSYMSYPRQSQICREENESWYSEFFWWWMMVPRLDQYWGMFAPEPANTDYWPVIDADLISKKDGTIIGQDVWRKDVFWDGVVSFSKYANPHDITVSDRWRKYIYGLMAHKNNPGYTRYFAEYWCRKYNSDDTNPYILDKFTLYSMSEKIYKDYKRSTTQKEAIWKQCCIKDGCFNEEKAQ